MGRQLRLPSDFGRPGIAIADQDLDFLADGETLTIDYTVTVSDASSSDAQTASVVVTGLTMPLRSPADRIRFALRAGQHDGSTSLDTTKPDLTGTLNFSDVDLADTHSVSARSLPSSANGTDVPASTQDQLAAAPSPRRTIPIPLDPAPAAWTERSAFKTKLLICLSPARL